MKKMHQVTLLGGRQKTLRDLTLFAGSLLVCSFALAQNAIQSLTGSVQSGVDVIRIETAEPLTSVPAGFTIQSPARIALDFPGVVNGIGRIGNQFSQKDILVLVERIDHNVHHAIHFCFELIIFGTLRRTVSHGTAAVTRGGHSSRCIIDTNRICNSKACLVWVGVYMEITTRQKARS